ncbi:MAG: bifunctional DNA-formamidopyrimidine glycosylase/DNA-(apurinic or apyrimidinic site) lyase [Rhodobacteraceae bacterium]|nr:bifunctional DNA-formamidopyrimidine glycosylase/DNA-(apurinic or apyrimidinic site) lyase [Paracoccaceae bacterium]
MPELPEVETIRRGLVSVMAGEVIVKTQVRRADLRWPFPDRMAERLTGVRVLALRRRSKYILVDLSSGETLLVHLGMSGRILISVPEIVCSARKRLGEFHHFHPAPEKHDHVVFEMANGARITFNDARRFGVMDLMDTVKAEAHPLLSVLGPEPLGNEFNESYLVEKFKNRNTPVKLALLDQHLVAGLGNIYVCETLYRARIHPATKTGKLKKLKVIAMVPIIRNVLVEAIAAGGSSLRDYRQADGELGYFQHSFQVYGREGEPCLTQDCVATISRIVQSGRSSFYCPSCQR